MRFGRKSKNQLRRDIDALKERLNRIPNEKKVKNLQ